MKQIAGKIRRTTVEGEQVSIDAYICWLYKERETSIAGLEFKKIKKINDRVDALIEEAQDNFLCTQLFCKKYLLIAILG